MRIEVIPALCRSSKRCWRIAPEVFEPDSNDFPWVQYEEIPEELQDRARKAVYACPAKALLSDVG
jgi:ferredoxin